VILTRRTSTRFLCKFISVTCKAIHAAKVKFFSSVEDNTCRLIKFILLSFHDKYLFVKHRSLQAALSSPQAVTEQALVFFLLSVQYCSTQRQETVKICVYERRY